jgi:mevalonate kinase
MLEHIGTKVTGSGGSGCTITLCNSKSIEKVAKNIEDLGGPPCIIEVSRLGLKPEATLS